MKIIKSTTDGHLFDTSYLQCLDEVKLESGDIMSAQVNKNRMLTLIVAQANWSQLFQAYSIKDKKSFGRAVPDRDFEAGSGFRIIRL